MTSCRIALVPDEGLSAALHLARKGAKVEVFERETVAFGEAPV